MECEGGGGVEGERQRVIEWTERGGEMNVTSDDEERQPPESELPQSLPERGAGDVRLVTWLMLVWNSFILDSR